MMLMFKLWLVGIFVLLSAPAWACQCELLSVREVLARVDGAFSGRIVEGKVIEKDDESGLKVGTVVHTIRAERKLKGDIGEEVRVVDVSRGRNCRVQLIVGRSIDLMGRYNEEQDVYEVEQCLNLPSIARARYWRQNSVRVAE
jgi:hypothetical protein